MEVPKAWLPAGVSMQNREITCACNKKAHEKEKIFPAGVFRIFRRTFSVCGTRHTDVPFPRWRNLIRLRCTLPKR
jgi:hypothetical protein